MTMEGVLIIGERQREEMKISNLFSVHGIGLMKSVMKGNGGVISMSISIIAYLMNNRILLTRLVTEEDVLLK